MYEFINHHIELVLDSIEEESDIHTYLWLLEHVQKTDVRDSKDFQKKYKAYWQLNPARLSEHYCQRYFALLEELKYEQELDIAEISKRLFQEPTHSNGRKSLQFSFATKLVHSIYPSQPIYDNMVRAFYFLPENKSNWSFEQKLDNMVANYIFLHREYQRVLEHKLLHVSIHAFRKKFGVDTRYTDIKIIDTLIWKFVTVLNTGAIRDSRVIYT